MKKLYSGDFLLIITIFTLTCIGIVMVFSASLYNSNAIYGDQYYIFRKQFIYTLIGWAAFIIVSRLDYKIYKKYALHLMGISIVLLILVFVPGIGHYANGAWRWIRIGPLQLQSSEVAKLSVIIFMASSLSVMKNQVRGFVTGFLPYMLLLVTVSGLIYIEPNLSTSLIVAAIIIGMLFIAGGNLFYIASLFGGVVSLAVYFIFFTNWRKDRLDAFLDPASNLTGTGWQSRQSILALGSGGIFGQGLGNGKQKMFFLPEPQNDFIFAHIGEELGLIGTLFILALFLLLIWRGLNIAMKAPDTFSSLLAFGLTLMIGIQVVINIAVVTQLIPVTGIPLPFISAGGSSIVFLMTGMGMLFNISRHIPPERR
ncbi:MAG: putative lipid II flippase FtsW [Eubacteriaceae bacterium]|nr:putative lipid II flippase FtsW [Eubacteriaceae bacterium]